MKDLHQSYKVSGSFGDKAEAVAVRLVLLEHLNSLIPNFPEKAITIEGKKGAFYIFFPRLRLYWHPSGADYIAELRNIEAQFKEVYL